MLVEVTDSHKLALVLISVWILLLLRAVISPVKHTTVALTLLPRMVTTANAAGDTDVVCGEFETLCCCTLQHSLRLMNVSYIIS